MTRRHRRNTAIRSLRLLDQLACLLPLQFIEQGRRRVRCFLHPFPKLFLGAAKNLRVCYGAILIVDGIVMRYALGCDWRRCSPTTLPRSHHLLLHLPLVHASLRRRQRPPVHTSVGTRRHACSLTIIQSRLVPADPLQRKPKRRPTELWSLCDVTLPGAQARRSTLGVLPPEQPQATDVAVALFTMAFAWQSSLSCIVGCGAVLPMLVPCYPQFHFSNCPLGDYNDNFA